MIFELERKNLLQAFSSLAFECMLNRIDFETNSSKDPEQSEEWRLAGNNLSKQINSNEKINNIWRIYTISIALAPSDSEEMALSYAERSALLYYVEKFEDSIVDINRAIAIMKSSVLKAKFLCYKVKCLHALNDLPKAEKTLQEAKYHIDGASENVEDVNDVRDLINITEKSLKEMFTKKMQGSFSFGEQETLHVNRDVNDFSSVKLTLTADHEQNLVATRDIEPGEVIFVEKIHTSSSGCQNYCSHCYKTCWTLIPCDTCNFYLYCSENCKEDSWNQYHDNQCSVITSLPKWIFFNSTFQNIFQIALKLLFSEYRVINNMTAFKAYVQNIYENKDESLMNFMKNGKFQSSGLKSVIALKSPDCSDSSLISSLTTSVLVSIAMNTSIFGKKFQLCEQNELLNNDDVLFIGSLIIKLTSIILSCGIEINNLDVDTILSDLAQMIDDNGNTYDITTYLTNGIGSIYNLVNCNRRSNAAKMCLDQNNMCVLALKPIKKNDEIFYDIDFYNNNKEPYLIKETPDFTCNYIAYMETMPSHLIASVDQYMSDPDGFANKICQCKLEYELYTKHKDIIESILKDEEYFYTEEILKNLAKSVTKATTELTQPSIVTDLILIALKAAFSNLYSRVPIISYF